MQSAVYLAGPFFTPFLLSRLQFSYLEYTLLISLGFVGKMIAMPLWGRLAQRHGARCLLWIGGVGIAPLSSLWIISHSGSFLVCLQLLSGITWAAHELAILLMFVDAIPQTHRTRLLTCYNLGSAIAMVSGGTLGGILLEFLGQSHSAYLTLFGLSSIVRCASLICLLTIRHPEQVSPLPVTRTVAVRPSAGSIEQPILAAIRGNVVRRAA
jgi:MFS family permease